MTLVFESPSKDPGLHALVVGVGCYDDGIGAAATSLRSAPNSAIAMATWLRDEYRNPDLPLRSIELVVSPPNPNFEVKIEFSGKSVERAYIGQAKPQGPIPAYGVAKAVKDWKERATTNEKNMTLFYFCGHGVQFQGSPHLLLEGFQPNTDAPFESAINFQKFWIGMEMCFARKQIYVVDSCRDIPSWVLAKQGSAPGRGLVELDIDRIPVDLPPRSAPIFYAASEMQRAGSNDGTISRFTKGFLEVMRGPACVRSGKPRMWRVSTYQIMTSLLDLRNRAILGDWDGQMPRLAGESAPFDFHIPEKPVVPVIIRKPTEKQSAAVKVDGAGCTPFNDLEWIGQAPIGDRVVSAESAEGTLSSVEVYVEPAYGEVEL